MGGGIGGGCIACVFGICVFMCRVCMWHVWVCVSDVCVCDECVCVYWGGGGGNVLLFMCACVCVQAVKGEDIHTSRSVSMRFLNLPACFSKNKKSNAQLDAVVLWAFVGVGIDGVLC